MTQEREKDKREKELMWPSGLVWLDFVFGSAHLVSLHWP